MNFLENIIKRREKLCEMKDNQKIDLKKWMKFHEI